MLVKIAFPEYLKVFSTLYGKASLALLHKYSMPNVFAKTSIDGLASAIISTSKGRHGHGNSTAAIIKSLAKSSVGDHNPVLEIQIRLYVETIRLLQ